MARRLTPLLLAALLATLTTNPVHGELENCLHHLAKLNSAPYNASLPFLNGVSGHINLAYLYQKPMFAVMPNEAMGTYVRIPLSTSLSCLSLHPFYPPIQPTHPIHPTQTHINKHPTHPSPTHPPNT